MDGQGALETPISGVEEDGDQARAPRESLNIDSSGTEGSARDVRRQSERSSFVSRSGKNTSFAARMSVATIGKSFEAALEADGGEGSHGLNFTEVVMNFAIACIGGGVVVFPKTMANAGYILCPTLLVIASALLLECGCLICRACDAAESANNLAKGAIADYEALAEAVGGPMFKNMLLLSKNSAFISFIVLFIVFVTDGIAKFFPGGITPGKQIIGKEQDENAGKPILFIRFCIVLPLFILLAMIKDMKQLSQFALVGVGAVAVQCTCIFVGSIMHYVVSPACRPTMERDAWGNKLEDWEPLPGCLWYEPLQEENAEIPKALSIFVFAYAIIGTLPSVRSQMAKPEELPKALSVSFVIISIAYLLVMGIGYLGFGELVGDNIIKSMDGPVGKIASISITVNLCLSSPVFLICIFARFESTGDDALRTPLTMVNVAFRALCMAVLAIVAQLLPYVMEIMGLASSLFCVANNMLIPLALFYVARRQWPGVNVSPIRMALHLVLLCVAAYIFVLGVAGSWTTLMQKIASGKSEVFRLNNKTIAADATAS